jgi:hypothetical protein
MLKDLVNNKYVFSLYPNLLTVDKPSDNIDINQLIEIIKYGYIEDIITDLRKPKYRKEYNKIKKTSIPCVTHRSFRAGSWYFRQKYVPVQGGYGAVFVVRVKIL